MAESPSRRALVRRPRLIPGRQVRMRHSSEYAARNTGMYFKIYVPRSHRPGNDISVLRYLREQPKSPVAVPLPSHGKYAPASKREIVTS
jgi:hypothetical protein